jgi:hypothetical protein
MLGGRCVAATLAALESASDRSAAVPAGAVMAPIASSAKRAKPLKRSTLSGKSTRCDQ